MVPQPERLARALGTCRQAVFYHELIERVSQRANKSWYIYGFMVKVPRVQLAIGDEFSVGISALELQNAESKRTATKNATKHIQCTANVRTVVPLEARVEGPLMPFARKGST
eukprot:2862979-Pleurochrysis_carterae.AAC.1